MSDFIEELAHDLTIRIDRTACTAYEYCVDVAPKAFRLGSDDIIEFLEPDLQTRDELIDAAARCPMEALIVIDSTGAQLVP